MNIKQEWAEWLAPTVDLPVEEVLQLLETPPRMEMGDLAFPCFRLSKVRRQAPQKIATELAAQLESRETPVWVQSIQAEGPYLNVSFARSAFVEALSREVLAAGNDYGRSEEGLVDGTPQKVLIDYSSPNIAKPFHVGHAFSSIIGHTLYRIHEHLGYQVVRINYLGDYGTQFGKLIVAYGLWCDHEALEEDPIKELTRIYVRFHTEAEERPELEKQAREAFKRLEEGSPEELELWQRFRLVSIQSFEKIYARLGMDFDDYNGESFYSKLAPKVVEELRSAELLTESEGAQVVMLDELNLPPAIILKSDGTTIYATRDIASILYRKEHYDFAKNIYVVGMPQTLHFKQVFAIVEKMGYDFAKDCLHVPFGTVKFPEGKMGTRTGDVVLLKDLLDEAVAKTLTIIRSNNEGRQDPMSEDEMKATAEVVGLGAVVHTFVRQSRERDIIFTWEDMLDFEGDTAPYLQYTYARGQSILRRQSETVADASSGSDQSESEEAEEAAFALAKAIAELPEAITAARRTYEPSMITRQLGVMARSFNSFYHKAPILKAQGELRERRLKLVEATCQALKTGLYLLGIGVVERM